MSWKLKPQCVLRACKVAFEPRSDTMVLIVVSSFILPRRLYTLSRVIGCISTSSAIGTGHCLLRSSVSGFDSTTIEIVLRSPRTCHLSEQVNISGAVKGQAVWPSDLKPIAWHRDSEMVRMKLGLYHSPHNVSAAKHQEIVIFCVLRGTRADTNFSRFSPLSF